MYLSDIPRYSALKCHQQVSRDFVLSPVMFTSWSLLSGRIRSNHDPPPLDNDKPNDVFGFQLAETKGYPREQTSTLPHDELQIDPREGRARSYFPRFLLATGWRMGLNLSVLGAFVVFFINLLSLVIVLAKFGWPKGGFPMLKKANCSEAKRISLWLRLLINVLSTCLLSASSYTMQVLVSPTRTELDKAHAKGDWLDIGASGLRNLKLGRIAKSRV